jgi:hypothetical protein
MTMRRDFYVYEHWRPDTDTCFWVGKGTGDRAYRFKRNRSYNQVIDALASSGMCAEVRLVRSGLTEFEALSIECERISFWRAASTGLTNRTNGGEGNRGMFVSEETRQKIRLANLGKKQSPETIAKRSASMTGKGYGGRPAGFKHSEATLAKMRAARIGRALSAETREKVRLANLGKKHSAETRAKMSAAHMGNTYGTGGKGLKRSEETRARMSAAQTGRRHTDETRAKMRASALKRCRETVS